MWRLPHDEHEGVGQRVPGQANLAGAFIVGVGAALAASGVDPCAAVPRLDLVALDGLDATIVIRGRGGGEGPVTIDILGAVF